MTTLLIQHALIVTMDDHQREIPDGGLFIRDGFIEAVGPTSDLPQSADQVLDLRGHVLLPGLVNTHHHFYQTLTRVVPAAQDANLFNWLTTLYPIWARLTPDDIFVSTQTALSELALSGCTTASDHLYLFPNGSRLDDEIAAANEIVCGEIAAGKFITMAYVAVDGGRGEIACASAGHPPPRLVLPDGDVRGLEAHGLVLGIDGDQEYPELRAGLPPEVFTEIFALSAVTPSAVAGPPFPFSMKRRS